MELRGSQVIALPSLVATAVSAHAAKAHAAGDRDAEAVHGFHLPFDIDPNVLLVGLLALAVLVLTISILYYALFRGAGGMAP